MPKIIFIIFLNFNFLMTVPHIPFVEAILESFEFTYLNIKSEYLIFIHVKHIVLELFTTAEW